MEGWLQKSMADEICVLCSSLNICVYICMYVCMYVYMFVCLYVCMYVCMCVCLHGGRGSWKGGFKNLQKWQASKMADEICILCSGLNTYMHVCMYV